MILPFYTSIATPSIVAKVGHRRQFGRPPPLLALFKHQLAVGLRMAEVRRANSVGLLPMMTKRMVVVVVGQGDRGDRVDQRHRVDVHDGAAGDGHGHGAGPRRRPEVAMAAMEE